MSILGSSFSIENTKKNGMSNLFMEAEFYMDFPNLLTYIISLIVIMCIIFIGLNYNQLQSNYNTFNEMSNIRSNLEKLYEQYNKQLDIVKENENVHFFINREFRIGVILLLKNCVLGDID